MERHDPWSQDLEVGPYTVEEGKPLSESYKIEKVIEERSAKIEAMEAKVDRQTKLVGQILRRRRTNLKHLARWALANERSMEKLRELSESDPSPTEKETNNAD